jgi:hypothetical protein
LTNLVVAVAIVGFIFSIIVVAGGGGGVVVVE